MFTGQPKNLGRYSSQNLRPKSSTKFPKVNNTPYQATLQTKNKKERDLSMRISLPLNFNHYKNKYNTLNSFHYQGTLTSQNFAGTTYFTYFPDYKNPYINHNLRKMICEQDKEIAENYEVLKELWEKLGVTEKYINNFDFMINAKCHNRESILEMLYKEKKQMKRFRIELMKVISEINKRENNINELKQYIEAYKEIKILNQMKESKNIENIDDVIRLQNISNVNKDLIESDIHECLKSIRLRTINVVNKVKKFETLYTELIKAKINMKIIKAKYGFDFNYLQKIKHDLDFLKDSEINNLYHFSPNGGDPFLLNISDKLKDPNDLQQYMSLPISNELLSIVKTYMFKLDTGDDETTTNMNIATTSRKNVDKLLSNKNLSNMAAMNSNRRTISDINNLRMQLQGEDNKYMGNQMLVIEEEKDKIKGMTSRQLIRHLQRYGRIKRELYPPFNKDLIKEQIQNRIIAKIENKISILENEFNMKINEKYKKKEKIIKDEEQTLMNEKNRIEQVGKQEEEERQKREQDYLNAEKERTKRKNIDKKIREENDSFMKRDNNIYLTEMEMKCMDDVNGKLKEGKEKDLVMKREQIENLEEKQRERKEELEKIRKISDDESESEENSDSEEESQTHKKRKKKKKKDKESDSDNNKKDSKNESKNESKNDSKSDSKKDSKNESKNEEDESDEDEDDDDSKSKSKSRKTKSKKKNSSKDDDEDEDDDDDDEDDDNDDKDDDEDDD